MRPLFHGLCKVMLMVPKFSSERLKQPNTRLFKFGFRIQWTSEIQTPLYQKHLETGRTCVQFSGHSLKTGMVFRSWHENRSGFWMDQTRWLPYVCPVFRFRLNQKWIIQKLDLIGIWMFTVVWFFNCTKKSLQSYFTHAHPPNPASRYRTIFSANFLVTF
jgi:hypothetical protein